MEKDNKKMLKNAEIMCTLNNVSRPRGFVDMRIEEYVDLKHHYAISQGTGSDKRWSTHVCADPETKKLKRIKAATKEGLYEVLYKFYARMIEEEEKRNRMSLRNTFEDWIRYKIDTTQKSSTARRIESDYLKYFVNEPMSQEILDASLDKLTRAQIKRWACQLIKEKHLTYKRFTCVFGIMRQVMDYLVDDERLATNTARNVRIDKGLYATKAKAPAHTQIFYRDELEALLTFCKEQAAENRDELYLAIPLMRSLGVRIGECLAFSFEDFDRQNHIVHVHRSFCSVSERLDNGKWTPARYEVVDSLKKGADPRDVVATDEVFRVVATIKAILFEKGIVRERLFSANNLSSVGYRLEKACEKVGIDCRSPHKLRKTYVSTLLNNGFDPDFVRTQAGHRNLETTLECYTYSTSRNDEMAEKLNKVMAI